MSKISSQIFKGAFKIFTGTLFSRIIGFLRTVIIANYIGAGILNDIIIAAIRIPNLLRRILGEKAVESTFLPVYKSFIVHNKEAEAEKLKWNMFIKIIIAALLFVLLGYVFSDQLILLIAGGFLTKSDKIISDGYNILEASSCMVNIVLPLIIFVCIFSFFGAVLLAKQKFVIYGLSPAIGGLFSILVILIFFKRFDFYSIGLAFTIGGGVQAIINFVFSRNKKNKRSSLLDKNEVKKAEKKVLNMFFPVLGDSAIEKIATVVDIQMASFLVAGSISALDYARLLFLLPLSLLSLSVNRTIMPLLTTQNAKSDYNGFIESLKVGIKNNLVFIIPASAGLFFLSNEIVDVVYKRGAFDITDVNMTGLALSCYSLGLVGMALTGLFSRVFYVLLDSKTPFKISALCLIINIILNFVFWKTRLAHGGLALATSIAFTLNAVILFFILKKRIKNMKIDYLLRPVLIYLLYSLIMIGLLILVMNLVNINRYVNLAVYVLSGIFIYFSLILVSKNAKFIRY